MTLIRKLKDKMFPLTLSRALEVVIEITQRGRRRPHWFNTPVSSLIDYLGRDAPVREIAPEDIVGWYDWLRRQDNQRRGGKLSAWTVDSYARSLRSFFNHLVRAGHLERTPCRHLVLPALPPKKKKDMSAEELRRMVQHSELNLRDHALVLVLRDSGCRVGELVSMTVEHLKIAEVDGELRGRAIIFDEKTHTSRWVYFGDEAGRALERYLRVRHHEAGEALWLTHSGRPLTRSGIYQALKRIGKRAGVANFNPHAFRHALAKKLVNDGAPHKVIQAILGHSDITTTLNMYVQYDEEELDDLHRQYGYD